MQYIVIFGLAFAGYTLIDWGYQRIQHRTVSMASLIFPPSVINKHAAAQPSQPVYSA